jgi:DivIVA domain-containing protein
MVATILLVLVVVLVIAGLVFGVITLLAGDDAGLAPADPDGRARPLPNDRSLHESDLTDVRFDVALRGYRMAQVDRVLRRTAYDLGYKDEMIAVLEAEVIALRDGRLADAEVLRQAREAAAMPDAQAPDAGVPAALGDDARVPDFAPVRHAPEAGDRAVGDQVGPDQPAEVEPEPREGSLRRNPARDTATPVPGATAGSGAVAEVAGGEPSALEVADRPAHA